MNRPLRYASIGSTDPELASWVTARLRAALDGSGPAFGPVAAPAAPAEGGPGPSTPDARWLPDDGTRVPDDVALVVRTSGSTGRARGVLLDTAALLASARATHDRLAGPGQWVLALPTAHIAGLQVLLRSVLAGTEPVVLSAAQGFTPEALAAATARAVRSADGAGLPLYTSLVPTQLHRVLATVPDGADLPPDLEPLRRLDAILLGGAAAPTGLLDRTRAVGLRVVTTYGMTETCGGCVYDGEPLPGVRVDVSGGVVRLAGPVLARGYLDPAGSPEAAGPRDSAASPELSGSPFTVDPDGTRWLRTRDLGRVADGVLQVLGRSDDMLLTGGQNVAPSAVEATLADAPGVAQVCVVGVPDAEWGQLVTAVVVPGPASSPDLETLRATVSRTLGPAAAPRRLVLVDALPERGPGKVDRAAVAALATRRLADRSDPRPDGTQVSAAQRPRTQHPSTQYP